MTSTNETDHHVNHQVCPIWRHFWKHPLLWIVPTLVLGGLASVYALVREPQWVARQALTVREDYDDHAPWSGQFNEAQQQRHAQETFLELARSPAVVAAALRQVGPPVSNQHPRQWPTPEDVAAARERLEIVAPNGMEFGTTRVFYLNVSNPRSERAIELTKAICDKSETRFKQLREEQIRGQIKELENTVQLTEEKLAKETARLQELETQAGPDLAELRMLSQSFGGNSNLQTTLTELQQELRQVENLFSANNKLLELLTAAQNDPAQLVATPNRLLESQPALRSLKEGLIEAQLNTSELLGTMSSAHPRVKAAQVAESEIRGHLHRELEVAVRGLRAEQSLYQTRMERLTQKVNGLQQRLRTLATVRASYNNQLAEVQQQADSLANARNELNGARADLAAGDAVALLNRVDAPQTGPYPEGPSRAVIAAGGGVGGFLLGLGIIFLTAPAPVAPAPPVAPVSVLPSPCSMDHSFENQNVPADAGMESSPEPDNVEMAAHASSAADGGSQADNRGTDFVRVPTSASRSAPRVTTLKEALARRGGESHSWKQNT